MTAKVHILLLSLLCLLGSCSAKSSAGNSDTPIAEIPEFNADSAYFYIEKQVGFGPRVPNTAAHTQTAEWLASELKRHGAEVTLQKADLNAFDGTVLHAVNIIGQYRPDAADRTLLMAHYDCRPWADEDPDPAKRNQPVDGANDGASGVGVLLEAARQLSLHSPSEGIDILFADAEDWGDPGDELSWALGTRYFVNHPFKSGYLPSRVILFDMVGGRDAKFPKEYLSLSSSPQLTSKFWQAATYAGYSHRFPNSIGGAVTDDHTEFHRAGIQAIDIIEYRPETGFAEGWHTSGDTLDKIDRETLKAVGQTLMQFLYGNSPSSSAR